MNALEDFLRRELYRLHRRLAESTCDKQRERIRQKIHATREELRHVHAGL